MRSHTLHYRPDIDGLRAIAVLSVVCFHAFPLQLKNGFIGVDIFFVISGFLISGIILRGLEQGSFSFYDFYARRIRRIFPALFIVLSTSLIFGWFTLFPDEYMQFGKHVAGGVSFISNFLYWQESGYFDNAAITKPLLHLWSLAIEEQFYIIWPLCVWFAWSKRLNLFTLSFLAICISYTLMNIHSLRTDMVLVFYAPYTRFWELLAGSLLAYIHHYKPMYWVPYYQKIDHWLGRICYSHRLKTNGHMTRQLLGIIGIVLIIVGLSTVNQENFPNSKALFPTLGTICIITAGSNIWINRALLSHPLAVWLGLISFPLYLWHWPILSFMHILHGKEPVMTNRLAAVAASIFLAWITYHFIERPLRFGTHHHSKTILLCILMIVVGGAGYYIYHREGLAQRKIAQQVNFNELYSPEVNLFCFAILRGDDSFTIFTEKKCDQGTAPGRPKVFLIGDSYAAHLGVKLRPLLKEKHYDVYQFAASGCASFGMSDLNPFKPCANVNEYVWKEILQKKPDLLIIYQHYGFSTNAIQKSYPELLLEKSQQLLAIGVKKIIIVGQIPKWTNDLPRFLVRKFWLKGKPIPERTYKDINYASLEWDEKLRHQPYPQGVTYISLKDFLCNKDGCLTRVGDNLQTEVIIGDRNGHLSNAGARYITQEVIAPYIDNIIE